MLLGTGAGRGGKRRLLKGGLALAWVLLATPGLAQSVEAAQSVEPAQPSQPVQNSAPVQAEAQPASAPTSVVPPSANPVSAEPAPAAGQAPAHHNGHHGVEEEPGIVVSSRTLAPDPGKALNKASFAVTQAVDQAVIEPLASGYEAIVPSTARDGLHNALYNLREPVIAANFLLQHKIGKTGETIARFVINSTIGLAGIFDIAKRKPFKLRFRENGFANTLGFYGVGNGPYIFLPMLGSTTLRDFAGRMVDRGALPLAAGGQLLPTAAVVPMIVIGILDRRMVNKERLRQEREAEDPYTVTRDNYLRRRAAEIEYLRHPRTAPPVDEEEEGG